MSLSVERVVALLTPAFAALSAAATGWLAQHFPGLPHLNPTDVTALMVAGAGAAGAASWKWVHGRQKFMADAHDAETYFRHAAGAVSGDPQAGPALADIEQLLRSHTDQIVKSIGDAAHAPASVEQVVQAIADKLASGQPSTPAPSA